MLMSTFEIIVSIVLLAQTIALFVLRAGMQFRWDEQRALAHKSEVKRKILEERVDKAHELISTQAGNISTGPEPRRLKPHNTRSGFRYKGDLTVREAVLQLMEWNDMYVKKTDQDVVLEPVCRQEDDS
jgi:hypothetical protein